MSVMVLNCWTSKRTAGPIIFMLKFVELVVLNLWSISSLAIAVLIAVIVQARKHHKELYWFYYTVQDSECRFFREGGDYCSTGSHHHRVSIFKLNFPFFPERVTAPATPPPPPKECLVPPVFVSLYFLGVFFWGGGGGFDVYVRFK